MNEQPLTLRELEHFFGDVKDDVKEIKVQVKTTNGRVNKLENWRWFMTGGLAILTAVVLPVLFLVISNYLQARNVPAEIMTPLK